MFIKLHDQSGNVHLVNPRHVVEFTSVPPSRTDSKTKVTLVGNMTLLCKETLGEVFVLCSNPPCRPGVLLDDDLPQPYGAESLTPEWVKAVDAQIKKE